MNRSLEIPNLIVTEEEDDGPFRVVHVRSIEPVAKVCNLACSPTFNGWREKPREINDVPHYGRPTILAFHERRFACPDCDRGEGKPKGNSGIYEHITFVQDGTWMTHRAIDWMARECVRAPFAEIARKVGVDRKTAAKAFALRSDAVVADRKAQVPRVLGIDEIGVKGEMRAVLGDVENNVVLDMLEDRTEALEWQLVEWADRRELEVVATDRHDPYRLMIAKRLPGRLHVTDKWHVLQYANKAMDDVRIGVVKRLSDRRLAAGLRNAKSLFHLRWHDADERERATIIAWFKHLPILADAYWTKERYFELYLCHSTYEAEAYYKNWLRKLPGSVAGHFLSRCKIPRRWMPMLIAYFEEPYTTGFIESVNRFIADQDRDGRGYSFEVMRAKLLLREPLENLTYRPKVHLTRPKRKRRQNQREERELRRLQRGYHEPMELRGPYSWSTGTGAWMCDRDIFMPRSDGVVEPDPAAFLSLLDDYAGRIELLVP